MLEDLYFLRILFALMSFDAQTCTCICICNIFMHTPKLKFRPGGSQGGMVSSLIKLYKINYAFFLSSANQNGCYK